MFLPYIFEKVAQRAFARKKEKKYNQKNVRIR